VHGDLHNHTLLSDDAGDPELAFETMRAAGLDVAAITDHALYPGDMPLDEHYRIAHGYLRSMTDDGWRQVAKLATRAQREGVFVALRGFEWTSPQSGHMNVWFSEHWTDSLSTYAYREGDEHVAWTPARPRPGRLDGR
jgi:histidinol phosphatase-like PHP family hydrolase